MMAAACYPSTEERGR